MEKNTTPVEQPEDVVSKARAHKNTITGIAVAFLVLLAGFVVWNWISQRNSAAADEKVALADMEPNDSIALALYQEAAQAGYPAGNRAKAEAGIRLYRQGKYAEAAEYLNDCDLNDNIAEAGVKTLEGDCYVNLEQYDRALECYSAAVRKADGNPQLVPFILVKEAHIYRAQQNYSAEADAYRTIVEQYPQYNAGGVDIRALYERARAQAAAN
ncbi:MAG: hypothetical protein J6C67_06100 [Muribaculaceae bacterium]|nr:hypothetical protein [Muribaculaceae bacterium]